MRETKIYSKRRLFLMGLTIGLGVTLIVLVVFEAGVFDVLEQKSIDWRFLARGETDADPRIVIVSIDESSFSELNQKWPWPRTYFARLIDRLSEEGARIIAIDILMSEPYPGDQDKELARSARMCGNVIFPSKFEEMIRRIKWTGKEVVLSEEVLKGPVEEISESGDVGYINLPYDGDGFVRRFTPIRSYQGTLHASYHLKIATRYLGIPLTALKYVPYRAIHLGDRSIPLNLYDSAYINFAGPSGKFQRVSFHQALNGHFSAGFFKEKIVLVGATFSDSHDFFLTPFLKGEQGSKYPLSGVEVHANIIHTILQGRFIEPVPFIQTRFIMLLGGLLVVLLSLRLSPLKGAVSVLLIIVAYLLVSLWLFSAGTLLTTTGPVAAFCAAFFSLVVLRYFTEEREKRRIRGIFQRYVSADVVSRLIQDPASLRLGGETRELTVLFSDIRGFTAISEKQAPDELLSQLNQYLTAMTDAILRNGGMLDKYVGDAIMAVFGAPLELDDHALVACRTALEMSEELSLLQEQWKQESRPILDMGIGIHTGPMVIGNVGSPKRMDYTVIGDSVNLASRLEGVNKELGTHIIISQSTYGKAKEHIRVKNLGEIKVRGKEKAIAIYELIEMS